jgi:hypothetical protein
MTNLFIAQKAKSRRLIQSAAFCFCAFGATTLAFDRV